MRAHLVNVLKVVAVGLRRDRAGIRLEDERQLLLGPAIEGRRGADTQYLVHSRLHVRPIASLDGHVVDVVRLER